MINKINRISNFKVIGVIIFVIILITFFVNYNRISTLLNKFNLIEQQNKYIFDNIDIIKKTRENEEKSKKVINEIRNNVSIKKEIQELNRITRELEKIQQMKPKIDSSTTPEQLHDYFIKTYGR